MSDDVCSEKILTNVYVHEYLFHLRFHRKHSINIISHVINNYTNHTKYGLKLFNFAYPAKSQLSS